jgi:hypothetical protein
MSTMRWPSISWPAAATVTQVLFAKYGPDGPAWQYVGWIVIALLWLWYLFSTVSIKARLDVWREKQPAIFALVLIMLGSSTVGVLWWQRPQSPRPPPTTPVIGPTPVIQFEFQPIGEFLPLAIMPRSSIAVVHIHDDGHVAEMQHLNNDHKNTLYWPTNEPIAPPVSVARLRISNIGDADAFDVVVRLRFTIGADNLPGGTKVPQIELQPVALPSSSEPRVVYFVNHSTSNLASVWFPPNAKSLVRGELTHRLVPAKFTSFGLPTLQWNDSVTGEVWVGMSGIMPSTYQWPA